MYAGGQYLESFAEQHARRQMTALLARVPRTAMRYRPGGLEEVGLDALAPGDRLLIRQGDVVPVDGTIVGGIAVIDESALTGESIPVQRKAGEAVISGSTNVGEAFDLLALRRAADSTYAGIVRLVEAAQRSKAPMSRLADRFALAFLGVTVAIAAAAWLWTGDPIRAVAVLVVATPCPLILAVPVAIVSGVSRAARHGILVKGGQALETLARVRTVVIDKTGTLTEGRARLMSINVAAGLSPDELLRLAASLDQASRHVIAETIVAEARRKARPLGAPSQVRETAGEGIEGAIDGRHVVVGGRRFVAARARGEGVTPPPPGPPPGSVVVAVAVDGRLAGELVLADRLRAGTALMFNELRAFGVERIVLATGDRREVAEAIDRRPSARHGSRGVDARPEDPGGPVGAETRAGDDDRRRRQRCARAGCRGLGVAMGAGGAAASAEAADIVLLVDELDRVLPAIRIARRSRSDRAAKRLRRDRVVVHRHDRGRVRVPAAGSRRARPGGDRRGGHRQRAESASRQSAGVTHAVRARRCVRERIRPMGYAHTHSIASLRPALRRGAISWRPVRPRP